MENEEKSYNQLLGKIKKLADKTLTGDKLALEIQRCKAINELSKTAIATANLMRRSEKAQEKQAAKKPRNKKT